MQPKQKHVNLRNGLKIRFLRHTEQPVTLGSGFKRDHAVLAEPAWLAVSMKGPASFLTLINLCH